MKTLPSFVQDTDNMLQKIEQINESGKINMHTNLLGLDAVNMYNMMPTELSEVGVKEYLETRDDQPEQPLAVSVPRVMKMCQENNNFQFKDLNYRQTAGFAIGQKYSPPAACLGAGIAERIFQNMPRDIVFDSSPHVMKKDADDPMFWSVRDMILEWLRYIDDCFSLFQGDREQAQWCVEKLNSLFPGQLIFTFEFEEISLVFLDMKITIDRQNCRLEVDKYIKPTNAQLYLNFRSCHSPHVFPSIIYSQALTAFKICSKPEWREIHFENLREKFLSQNYPEEMIRAQFEKVLKLNRSDLIFKRNKKNVNKKNRFAAPVIVTYHPQNPPVQRWIREDLGILHLSRQCREILPTIPVVTRQAKSVGQISVRSRHWQKTDQRPVQSTAG